MISPFHQAFEVVEASQVGHARRAAVKLAEDAGLDDVAVGRVALVVTELGTNLVRHARHGRLLTAAVAADDGGLAIEVIATDRGPGMRDVAASLVDGHSTGGSPGTGFGAVRRLSDAGFEVHSVPGRGSTVVARVRAAPAPADGRGVPRFVVGGVASAIAGETTCGDAWGAVQDGARAALLLADGLGHGPEAAHAARQAVAAFGAAPFAPGDELLDRVHERLRATRGAAVAVAQLDAERRELAFCGAGNVAGRILTGTLDRPLLSQHGTAGVQIRRTQVMRYEWPDHGILVLHSDGLTTRWHLAADDGLPKRHPTTIAATLWAEHHRGRDDASIVVLKGT